MINLTDHDNVMKWIETFKRQKRPAIFITLMGVIVLIIISYQYCGNSKLKNEILELRQNYLQEQNKVIQLQQQLQPFEQIAKYLYPELEIAKALSKLTEDIKELQKMISKYEFTPMSSEIKEKLLANLKGLKESFEQERLSIEITYETWVLPNTRKFAQQLANLLSEAGLNVIGPKFATVYLASPSCPIEWGFSKDDTELMESLHQYLQILIRPSQKHCTRTSFQKGKMRIHFAGQVIFDPSGVVSIE